MWASYFLKPINVALSIMLLAFGMTWGYWIASGFSRVAPITVLGAEAISSTLRYGEVVLPVQFTLRRRRLCETDTDRFILRSEDRSIIARERVLGIGAPVTSGLTTVTAYVQLPDNLPPGKYIFRGFIFSNCGKDDFHALQQPDVPFTISAESPN